MDFSPDLKTAFDEVIVDLQSVCSQVEEEQEAQRIRDLRLEVQRRDEEVTKRERLRQQMSLVRDFCSHAGYTDVALALIHRIEELDEEINRLRPVSQRAKLEQSLRRQTLRKVMSPVLPRFEEIFRERGSTS